MKKFIFVVMAMVAVAAVFTGCKKDDEKPKATVTIAGNGFNIDETINVTTATMTTTPVKVDIAAEGGIENLSVGISSTSAGFTAALGVVGLNGEFDLANPTTAQTSVFNGLNLANGAAVKGKTTLLFDISSFVPMMGAFIPSGDFTADFKITVKNPAGDSATKTIKMSFKAQ